MYSDYNLRLKVSTEVFAAWRTLTGKALAASRPMSNPGFIKLKEDNTFLQGPGVKQNDDWFFSLAHIRKDMKDVLYIFFIPHRGFTSRSKFTLLGLRKHLMRLIDVEAFIERWHQRRQLVMLSPDSLADDFEMTAQITPEIVINVDKQIKNLINWGLIDWFWLIRKPPEMV